jgi:RNA polymerase sigma factor (sigma-70 family)
MEYSEVHENDCGRWTPLVAAIRAGDSEAATTLYLEFGAFKGYFARQIGPEGAEDCYHDLILAVITSITQGKLREPERLAGYARSTARQMVWNRIRTLRRLRLHEVSVGGRGEIDTTPSPEVIAIDHEAKTIALRVLEGMSARDRAVLTRYYLEEDEPEAICADLDLTRDQFRLIKSRAKGRFEGGLMLRIQPQRVRALHRKTA